MNSWSIGAVFFPFETQNFWKFVAKTLVYGN